MRASPTQEEQIRMLSDVYFSDPLKVFTEIGYPATREDASDMIKALNTLTLGATFDELVAALPTDLKVTRPITNPSQEQPMSETSQRTRRCADCGEEKKLSSFRKRGRGRQSTCNSCYTDPRVGQPHPSKGKFQPPREKPLELPDDVEPVLQAPGTATSTPEPVASNGATFRDPPLSALRGLAVFFETDLEGAAHICAAITVKGGAVSIRGDAA